MGSGWVWGFWAALVVEELIRSAQMELESVAISDVLELKAVLDSGVFNSLLTVSVKSWRKGSTSIFVFQCEDVRVSTHICCQNRIRTNTPIYFIPPPISRLTLSNEIFHEHF